jgi:multidrug resistance efflux pump
MKKGMVIIMKSDIFRKSALDSVATPEQLDQQVRIMKPVTWIILCAVAIGFITLTIWGTVGNIISGVTYEGVIFPNTDVSAVVSKTTGIVSEIMARQGDYLEAGDIIAVVYNQAYIDDIRRMKKELLLYDENSAEFHKAEEALNEVKENYIRDNVIVSSESGYVQNIITDNTPVAAGDRIATIMTDDKANTYKEVIVYVPKQEALSLTCGMMAEISPEFAPREEYGYMKGTVSSISDVPVTEESIIKHMGTMDYVSEILPDTGCVEVKIRLDIDKNTGASFQWSNKKGEELSIEIGTICDIYIVTKEQKPINLIFE